MKNFLKPPAPDGKTGLSCRQLNEILKKSGAPKGSLYYYFPEGKEEIAREVILRAGKTISARIQEKMQADADVGKATHDFLDTVAHRMEETKFHSGSPFTILAKESAESTNRACREAYGMLIGAFKDALEKGGWK